MDMRTALIRRTVFEYVWFPADMGMDPRVGSMIRVDSTTKIGAWIFDPGGSHDKIGVWIYDPTGSYDKFRVRIYDPTGSHGLIEETDL